MSDGEDREEAIAALEAARDRLEAILRGDAGGSESHRLKLAGGAGEPRHESDVRKSWKLVNEALGHLRTADEARREAGARFGAASDDLTFIRGIDPALAQHLASLGVTRFADIAAWRPDDVRNVSQALGLTREISRQNWIEQAALLQRHKEDAGGVPAPQSGHAREGRPQEQARPATPQLGEGPMSSAGSAEVRKEAHLNNDAADAPSALALELARQTLSAGLGPAPAAMPSGKIDAEAPTVRSLDEIRRLRSDQPDPGRALDAGETAITRAVGPQHRSGGAARSPRPHGLLVRLIRAVTGR